MIQQYSKIIINFCQRGFANYSGALDDANDLLAECYGVIGRLNNQNDELINLIRNSDGLPEGFRETLKSIIN
jgi:hypothetical protein